MSITDEAINYLDRYFYSYNGVASLNAPEDYENLKQHIKQIEKMQIKFIK